MKPVIVLDKGAEENGFAVMLSDLVRQNLESKPHKEKDLVAISGSVAIVVVDAEVALTMRFQEGTLTILDGIAGIPDVTIRGNSDIVLALSNMPLTARFGLPIPDPRDKDALATVKSVFMAVRSKELRMFGAALHPKTMFHLTRVMSVHG